MCNREAKISLLFCFEVARSAPASDFFLKSVYVKLVAGWAALFIDQAGATSVEIFQAPVSYPNAVFHCDLNQIDATKM